MPQALIGFLVQIGLSQLAATLVATVVTIGASMLLNALFGPSRPKPLSSRPQGIAQLDISVNICKL